MQKTDKEVMKYTKISSATLAFVALMMIFSSCHKETIQVNPLATFNIELTKKYSDEGIVNKSLVTEFDASVSIAYEDDTVVYDSKFIAVDSVADYYIYDYSRSDILYASKGKPFRVIVDAIIGGVTFHGESEIYVLEDEPVTTSINMVSSFNYVDLGLPSGLKWAKCNLGATSPEEYGSYFAWGETTDKVDYSWDTYSYYNDSVFTKYNGSDGLSILEATDDASTARLGVNWRIPTKAEFEELLNNCTATFTTSNGVNGYRFTGPNGNSIFMPMAGGRDGDGLLSGGESGFYWLSSLYSDDTDYAWGFLIDSESVYATSYYRMYGQTIRPVFNE